MRIIGVDPGANFTGIAVLDDTTGEFEFWGESDDPVVIWEFIALYARDGVAIVILEDMLGSGRRDEYIQRTIEVLGYLDNRCREAGVEVQRVPQQARLANVRNVPPEIRRKDERSAAAHALSYRERKRIATDKDHRRKPYRRGSPPAIPDPRQVRPDSRTRPQDSADPDG
jgi:hypothetical protein